MAGNGDVTVRPASDLQCALQQGATTGVVRTGIALPGSPGFGSPSHPQLGVTHTLADAPPAISGGTMAVLADGQTVVAADPDRDQVYVVDLTLRAVKSTIVLNHGDEPGRLVEDGAGRVHVALRRGGALVSISTATGTGDRSPRGLPRQPPRGVAYDSATDLLHVACADGQLVSLPAAGGAAVRTLQLDGDLRDVMVDGPRLRVSRFRTAELLTIEADGTMSGTPRAAPGSAPSIRAAASSTRRRPRGARWRCRDRRRRDGAPARPSWTRYSASPGGYGGFSVCDAIVDKTAVTVVAPQGPDQVDRPQTGPAMAGMVLPKSTMALSSDGEKVAIIAAFGNSTNSEGDGAPPRLPRLLRHRL